MNAKENECADMDLPNEHLEMVIAGMIIILYIILTFLLLAEITPKENEIIRVSRKRKTNALLKDYLI